MARYVCAAHPEVHQARGHASLVVSAAYGAPFVEPGTYPVCGLVDRHSEGPCLSPLVECQWCAEIATAVGYDPDEGLRPVHACDNHADHLLSLALHACDHCDGPVDYPTEWACERCARLAVPA